MGTGSSWDSTTWSSYASAYVVGKTDRAIFSRSTMKDEFDPAKIKGGLRESRDSADCPISTPIIIGSDVTGSMGILATTLMRGGIDKVCTELYDRAPVVGPQIMTAAIGDAYYDRSPLQVTQFERDIRIAEQTAQLYIEGGGGGNAGESYALMWLFAAMKTETDSFQKRGHKGYLFTIGDEPILGVTDGAGVTKEQAKQFLDIDIERDLSAAELLEMASQTFECFHIVVSPYGRVCGGVGTTWKVIMPERLVYLDDVSKLGETIVSTIQVYEGASKAKVAASWGGGTDLVVANALRDLAPRAGGTANELVALA